MKMYKFKQGKIEMVMLMKFDIKTILLTTHLSKNAENYPDEKELLVVV